MQKLDRREVLAAVLPRISFDLATHIEPSSASVLALREAAEKLRLAESFQGEGTEKRITLAALALVEHLIGYPD